MQQPTPLKVWMDEKGYSYVSLAKEMGFSYEYIYKIALGKNDKWMTGNFKFRFIECFGWQEASKVFEVPEPTPTPA